MDQELEQRLKQEAIDENILEKALAVAEFYGDNLKETLLQMFDSYVEKDGLCIHSYKRLNQGDFERSYFYVKIDYDGKMVFRSTKISTLLPLKWVEERGYDASDSPDDLAMAIGDRVVSVVRGKKEKVTSYVAGEWKEKLENLYSQVYQSEN